MSRGPDLLSELYFQIISNCSQKLQKVAQQVTVTIQLQLQDSLYKKKNSKEQTQQEKLSWSVCSRVETQSNMDTTHFNSQVLCRSFLLCTSTMNTLYVVRGIHYLQNR